MVFQHLKIQQIQEDKFSIHIPLPKVFRIKEENCIPIYIWNFQLRIDKGILWLINHIVYSKSFYVLRT